MKRKISRKHIKNKIIEYLDTYKEDLADIITETILGEEMVVYTVWDRKEDRE